ncbi:MAG: conserved rane protein of unknown function [Firmicutes bacterium]|nr:conserved rane protein of unknown function [Bacillota bacterium]
MNSRIGCKNMKYGLLSKIIGDNIFLIRYGILGVTGASLDFIVFALLTKTWSINYISANVISVSLGLTNNFVLNVLFNFKVKNNLLSRFLKFYSIGLLGMGLSILTLYLLIEMLQINLIIAKVATIISVPLVQFYLNKYITFKGYREKDI